jgi:hypothetical protein
MIEGTGVAFRTVLAFPHMPILQEASMFFSFTSQPASAISGILEAQRASECDVTGVDGGDLGIDVIAH